MEGKRPGCQPWLAVSGEEGKVEWEKIGQKDLGKKRTCQMGKYTWI